VIDILIHCPSPFFPRLPSKQIRIKGLTVIFIAISLFYICTCLFSGKMNAKQYGRTMARSVGKGLPSGAPQQMGAPTLTWTSSALGTIQVFQFALM